MTKEATVCGAATRAGGLCQNTLVTGCGRCPVHASQLRASKALVKGRRAPPGRRPLAELPESFLQSYCTGAASLTPVQPRPALKDLPLCSPVSPNTPDNEKQTDFYVGDVDPVSFSTPDGQQDEELIRAAAGYFGVDLSSIPPAEPLRRFSFI